MQAPTPARTRRRERRGTVLKRAAILRVAEHLFSRQGIGGTSMDAIAAGAQVSKATLYAYFDNKEALFRATVDAMQGRMPDRWSVLLGAAEPVQTRLAAVADDLLDMADGPVPWTLQRMIAQSAHAAPSAAATPWERCFARYDRAMRRFLRAECRRGTLLVADPAQASAHFFGLILGASALRALLGGTAVPRPAWVDSAVALFMRGYRAEPPGAARSPAPSA
ncbi:TetR/AcrR family transcriptional regulator [Xanthomonas sp. A2111]|uniref:TetR/AcrR family transcriptional regulator n=1 Tax=Xanthomonas hawaiiensis TaxID=3003247 RepID=A0ABU2I2P2_9XANT|nr:MULTISPECIES: TetR/AcrR family transcriptional regulator [unclassified Xanthomonas]MBO9830200.1 TetR/AcrR family transcriptional regulator [Xanthomonas sp. A2111]MBO9874789.1 TetR/AcrR family transcriptional regulator [Xanthomonas sp. D-93]MDS9991672.1 TetR/AcrR family transcriptional regulator [Xanthomonas sp. A2111]WNH43491.1 TetR/AcrR family transcriptional regulator [Xanthomonas sp. A6251]